MKAPPFAAPDGTELVRLLGRGSSFSVAVVAVGGVPAIAKRALPGAHFAVGPVEREQYVLAHVANDGIPRLIDAGTDAAGPYVIESLFEGEPPIGERAAPAREQLALRVLSLIETLHGAGLVHGDPSRANFISLASGRIALIDFGSSGWLDVPAVGQGTLPYAAPELCRAETSPSQMTDRYAISVLVAELCGVALSGHGVGPAALVEIGERGHDLDALRASDLRPSVRDALAELLAFDPAARPASLAGLRVALERAT